MLAYFYTFSMLWHTEAVPGVQEGSRVCTVGEVCLFVGTEKSVDINLWHFRSSEHFHSSPHTKTQKESQEMFCYLARLFFRNTPSA